MIRSSLLMMVVVGMVGCAHKKPIVAPVDGHWICGPAKPNPPDQGFGYTMECTCEPKGAICVLNSSTR